MWVDLWVDGEKVWMGRLERLTRLDPGEGSGSSALEVGEVGCCAKRSVGGDWWVLTKAKRLVSAQVGVD